MKKNKHEQFLGENKLQVEQLSSAIRDKVKLYNQLKEKAPKYSGDDATRIEKKLKALDLEIFDDLLEEFEDGLQNNDLPTPDPKAAEKAYKNSLRLIKKLPELLRLKMDHWAGEIAPGTMFIVKVANRISDHQYLLEISQDDQKGKTQPGIFFAAQMDLKSKTLYATERKLNKYYQNELLEEFEADSKMAEDRTAEYTHTLNEWLNGIAQVHEKKIKETAKTKKNPMSDEQILKQLFESGKTKEITRSFLRSKGLKHPLKSKVVTIGNYQLKRTSWFTYTYSLQLKSNL